jgi:hypothetical protein
MQKIIVVSPQLAHPNIALMQTFLMSRIPFPGTPVHTIPYTNRNYLKMSTLAYLLHIINGIGKMLWIG